MRNFTLLNNNVFCSRVTSSSSASKDDSNTSKKNQKSSVKSFQSLTFREKHSNTKVCLIGTMHYNPRSIELVHEMTSKAIEDGTFGCLVLESCEKRWEKTLEFQRPGTIRRQLLDNEFQAAQELVEDQSQVSLGDQSIDDLGQNMKRIFKETLEDVKSIDGWKRVREDLVRYSATELYPTKEFGKDVQTLSLQDFLLDGRLLRGVANFFVSVPVGVVIEVAKISRAFAFVLFRVGEFAGVGRGDGNERRRGRSSDGGIWRSWSRAKRRYLGRDVVRTFPLFRRVPNRGFVSIDVSRVVGRTQRRALGEYSPEMRGTKRN